MLAEAFEKDFGGKKKKVFSYVSINLSVSFLHQIARYSKFRWVETINVDDQVLALNMFEEAGRKDVAPAAQLWFAPERPQGSFGPLTWGAAR